MGTVTAGAIIDKASIQLTDIPGVRWTRAELLSWLNDGQRQIVLMQPHASNTVTSVALAAGTRQSLPANGWLLLGINCNMGTNGTTPGRAVRIISRELLDNFDPDWRTAKSAAVTKNYMYDPQDQLAYHVYPPSTGANYLQINYSKQPQDLVAETDTIDLMDVFQMPLLDYMLYRACSKDAEYAPGVQLAQTYAASFMAAVGGKEAAELKSNPTLELTPRNPALIGSDS
jgi:hypothetical protein